MSQTKEGAKKAKATILERYGDDFYTRISKIGGSVKGVEKGFAANKALARAAGAKGGSASRRTHPKPKSQLDAIIYLRSLGIYAPTPEQIRKAQR